MPLAIRSATIADVPAILGIEQQAGSAAHWPAQEYERLVNTGAVLVAEEVDAELTGNLRGFVCARVVVGEWEIENVVVAAEFLRQGIADQLLRALVQRAERSAVSRILLEVRESNRPARRLYEKHGFREAGCRRKYYNHPVEDAILYQRRCLPAEPT